MFPKSVRFERRDVVYFSLVYGNRYCRTRRAGERLTISNTSDRRRDGRARVEIKLVKSTIAPYHVCCSRFCTASAVRFAIATIYDSAIPGTIYFQSRFLLVQNGNTNRSRCSRPANVGEAGLSRIHILCSSFVFFFRPLERTVYVRGRIYITGRQIKSYAMQTVDVRVYFI